jgi:hypothetical protein
MDVRNPMASCRYNEEQLTSLANTPQKSGLEATKNDRLDAQRFIGGHMNIGRLLVWCLLVSPMFTGCCNTPHTTPTNDGDTLAIIFHGDETKSYAIDCSSRRVWIDGREVLQQLASDKDIEILRREVLANDGAAYRTPSHERYVVVGLMVSGGGVYSVTYDIATRPNEAQTHSIQSLGISVESLHQQLSSAMVSSNAVSKERMHIIEAIRRDRRTQR